MANEQQAGVLVRGPGTSTSDSIPAALSDGELVIPADDVRRFGAAHLMRMVKQMGSELPEPGMKHGVQHAAAGGLVTDPNAPLTNAVTRAGNSYSGGSVGGSVTINGVAPGGTVSTIDSYKVPAPPPPQPPLGEPASMMPIAPKPAVPAATAATTAAPATPPMAPGPGTAGIINSQPTQQIRSIFAPSPAQASMRPQAAPGAVPGYANGGLVDFQDLQRPLSSYSTSADSGAVMGRRPPINMGMAQEVPRTPLPPPNAAPGPLSARAGMAVTPTTSPQPATDLIGRRPAVNMGAADVVQPARLPGAPTPLSQSALPAPEAATRFPLSRAAAGAGAALGVGLEGKQVYDVATNPNASGLDVAAQAAQGVGRLGAAGAGAAGGAAAGSFLGPVGAAAGGIIGGGLGYFAADKAIAGGRELVGTDPRSPAEQAAALTPSAAATPAAAPTPPEGGGAVLGFFPQLGRNQFRSNTMDAQLRRGWQSTAPGVFAPAQPAVVPPPATPQRFDNLTDPRSTQYAGGANAAPLAPAMGEPLVDAFGNGSGAGTPAQDPNLPQGVSRSGNAYTDGSASTGVGFVGTPGVSSADRVGQMNRDAEATRSLSARALELARQGVGGPTPGLGVIENPGPAAAQAMFDGAALRTTLARGAPPGRNGAQAFAQQVEGASLPLVQRAQQQALQTKEQGDTVRAQLQEQGLASRARVQDARQADANSIARARLGLEQQKIGIDAAKANIAANKDTIQQVKDTQDIFSILDQAQPLLQQATNSTAGNAIDKLGQLLGVSTKGAEAGAQLKALQGALVAKMPKMSGPQSDKDVLLYREMAGQIGDPTIPREQRLAAMQTIRQLNEKYLPAPADAAGFASLPSGSTFRAPDGSIRRKP